MFSINAHDLCNKAESLSSLIQCIQASMGSDSLSRKDAFNVLGVALDISASIIVDAKVHNDSSQKFTEEPPLLISIPETTDTRNSSAPAGLLRCTIGERIRELRKMHNLTLKDIAEATGVTQQAVHLWESKGAIPSCDKLIPLANSLGCDPLWLIGN